MTTEITAHRIECDSEISVSLLFDIEAIVSPTDGWTITQAILVESAIWLESDKAEEAQEVCLDRTEWLRKFLKHHPGEREDIEAALTAQWERDRADEREYSSPSWREAVAAGVD